MCENICKYVKYVYRFVELSASNWQLLYILSGSLNSLIRSLFHSLFLCLYLCLSRSLALSVTPLYTTIYKQDIICPYIYTTYLYSITIYVYVLSMCIHDRSPPTVRKPFLFLSLLFFI